MFTERHAVISPSQEPCCSSGSARKACESSRMDSLTVSHSSYMLGLLLEAAGTAWQDADEADRETAADGGDGVRHVPLRSDRHHAAGSLRVAQVPRALGG